MFGKLTASSNACWKSFMTRQICPSKPYADGCLVYWRCCHL